jgi:RNA recognition motif-containing protein
LQPKADAAAAVPSTTELFVKNLPPTFVDDDLEKVFSVFGPLKHSYGAHLPPRCHLTHSAHRWLQLTAVPLTGSAVWATVQ